MSPTFFGSQNILLCQHGGMSDRAGDVCSVKTLVKGDRRCEPFHEFISGFGKTTAPELVCFWILAHVEYF